MKLEYDNRNFEQYQCNRDKYNQSCQEILQRDHYCNGRCLNYDDLQLYNLRLKQQRVWNYTLSLEDALLFCQLKLPTKISKQKNMQKDELKLVQIKNKIPFSKNNPHTLNVKKVIKKMVQSSIPITTQSAVLGLPIEKLKQISFGLNQISNCYQDCLFSFAEIHIKWLQEYLNIQNQETLSSSKHLYQDFLSQFQLSDQSLSIISFRKMMKSLGYRYKKSFQNQFQSDHLIKQKQIIFVFVNIFISHQRRTNPIYIDETGIGNENHYLKIWQQQKQSFKIDRTKLNKRINIIGAIGENLLVYQCLRCNVDSLIVKNFLIRLILICNEKYGRRNFVFVMDNASVHKEQSIQREVLDYVEHVFLPPYSPQLNPIEKIWSQFKSSLSKSSCRTGIKLNQEIHHKFESISNENILNQCNSVYQVLKQCLEKQEI